MRVLLIALLFVSASGWAAEPPAKKDQPKRRDVSAEAKTPFDLKGFKLGMTEEQVTVTMPAVFECTNRQSVQSVAMRECKVDFFKQRRAGLRGVGQIPREFSESDLKTLAEQPVMSYTLKFGNGRLSYIDVWFNTTQFEGYPSAAYAALRDALVMKFGKPTTSDRKQYTFRAAPDQDWEIVTWENAGQTMVLDQHALNSGIIILELKSDAYKNLVAEERRARSETRAKDL